MTEFLHEHTWSLWRVIEEIARDGVQRESRHCLTWTCDARAFRPARRQPADLEPLSSSRPFHQPARIGEPPPGLGDAALMPVPAAPPGSDDCPCGCGGYRRLMPQAEVRPHTGVAQPGTNEGA